MREHYEIKDLNPRKNPYYEKLKDQLLFDDLDEGTVAYFKSQALETGIPYKKLINLYLDDCAKKKIRLNIN